MIEQISHLLLALLTFGAGILLAKFLSDFLSDFLKKQKIEEATLELLLFGVRYFIYSIAFILAIAQLKIGIFVLQLSALFLTLITCILVFLSLKELVPNAAAWIYLKRTKLLQDGEEIEVDGIVGKVKKLGIVSTMVEDAEGKTILIPNCLLINKKITKFKGRA